MKAWYHSKTIWMAILEAVVGGVFQVKELVEGGGAEPFGITLIALAAVQTILRYMTETPIGSEPK